MTTKRFNLTVQLVLKILLLRIWYILEDLWSRSFWVGAVGQRGPSGRSLFPFFLGSTKRERRASQSCYSVPTVSGRTTRSGSETGIESRQLPVKVPSTCQVASVAEIPVPEVIPLAILAHQDGLRKSKCLRKNWLIRSNHCKKVGQIRFPDVLVMKEGRCWQRNLSKKFLRRDLKILYRTGLCFLHDLLH